MQRRVISVPCTSSIVLDPVSRHGGYLDQLDINNDNLFDRFREAAIEV